MTKVFIFPTARNNAATAPLLHKLKQAQKVSPFELVIPNLKAANNPPPEPPPQAA
ncbi:hypothetical protein NQS96_07805 [Pseudoalteromonas shioyasakiensis]|uniref:hypothetical protein n=1 Tax=Pseudoalteromonas TaxID=53246 RepID=UPI00131A37B1|nr:MULTISPECIES: hypothetical protein [Pseudoalteromonas]MCQ8881699.1 hypothetical protein [Pseudoalteromonas shioyasakiensis]